MRIQFTPSETAALTRPLSSIGFPDDFAEALALKPLIATPVKLTTPESVGYSHPRRSKTPQSASPSHSQSNTPESPNPHTATVSSPNHQRATYPTTQSPNSAADTHPNSPPASPKESHLPSPPRSKTNQAETHKTRLKSVHRLRKSSFRL